MKSVCLGMFFACVTIALAGCGDGGGNSTVTEDVEKSEVDKYNEMMEQQMAGYEEAEKASESADAQ